MARLGCATQCPGAGFYNFILKDTESDVLLFSQASLFLIFIDLKLKSMPDNKQTNHYSRYILCFLLILFSVISSCINHDDNPALNRKKIDKLFARANSFSLKADYRRSNSALFLAYSREKKKTDQLKSEYYLYVSFNYARDGMQDSALVFVDSCINVTAKHQLTDSIWSEYAMRAHTAKGNILFNTNKMQASIDEFFKAIDQARKLNDQCGVPIIIYHTIALAMYRQQDYISAKKYFEICLNIEQSCMKPSKSHVPADYDAANVQELLSDIALCYNKFNKLDSAQIYYQKALRWIDSCEKKGILAKGPAGNLSLATSMRGVIFGNIAQMLVKQHKFDSAEQLYKQSILINEHNYKDGADAQITQIHLAELYLQTKQYDELGKMLPVIRKSLNKLPNEQAELGWKKMSFQYADQTNQKNALTYYKTYIAMRDSLNEAKKEVVGTDLYNSLNQKSQQLEISLLKKDNQLNRAYLLIVIALSVLAIIIMALVWSGYYRSRRNVKALTALNNQINLQKDELEKVNKDKDRILHVVAHDLRNPISGATALISDVLELVEPGEQQILSMSQRALNNSLILINQLLELDLSPENIKLNKQQADLNEILASSVALMQISAGKKNQIINFEPVSGGLLADIDIEKFERLINNLLNNAIKFSPLNEHILLTLDQKDGNALIIVKDNGVGIPPSMQAGLFHVMNDSRRRGTAGEKSFGLGLSICKQIAEAHGGELWLKSEAGKGSSFFLRLPLGHHV